MKIFIYKFSLLFIFSFVVQKIANAQATQLVNGMTSIDPKILAHIEDLKIKEKDSTYKKPLIPLVPVDFSSTKKVNTINSHFPYPVILVHGLASNSDTWFTLYNYVLANNWSYGGRMDFCLNSDVNNSVANLTSDITDFTTTLTDADFYLVNFDVEANGVAFYNNVLSNQAAIYKQGIAIKKAIAHVLAVTGKDKVVILVHSMGGLATRQYIQNASLWQPDGKHHIAKLATLGTPHGGSNASGGVFTGFVTPISETSDAVRDLRRSYFYSGDSGVFLYGGNEDNNVMWDLLFSDFNNVDVNCNGTDGENIVGLNQKSIITDIDYTCLFGDYSLALTAGDGIVTIHDAQIKNFYPTLTSETFSCTSFHTSLPSLTKEDFFCIDEPDEFNLAYYVNKDTLYNGYITNQAPDATYTKDFDQYYFNVQQTGSIKINLGNWHATPYQVKLVDGSSNTVSIQNFSTLNATTTAIAVSPGKYYLQLSAQPNATSWQYPYTYKIDFTPTLITTSIDDIKTIDELSIHPNPTEQKINIKANNFLNELTQITIKDVLGHVIFETTSTQSNINEQFDLTDYSSGMYFVTVVQNSKKAVVKFIKS